MYFKILPQIVNLASLSSLTNLGPDHQKDCTAFVTAKPVQMREKNSVHSTKYTQRVKRTQTEHKLRYYVSFYFFNIIIINNSLFLS